MRLTPTFRHQLERQALWHAYDGKCGYQESVSLPGRPDGPDFEVDHVIPQTAWDDPALLIALKARFNLPAEFERDGYENLVPTTRLFNLAKLGRTTGPVWEAVIKHGLAQAKARAPRVRAELLRLTNAAVVARTPAVTEQERLTAILDLFTNQAPWTPGLTQVSRSYWEARRPNAAVFAYVPSVETFHGSALVGLRTAGVRGGMATLSHADVLRFLVRGRGAGLDPSRRPFLGGGRPGSNELLLILPNFRAWVPPAVAEELCEVADEIAELFVGSMGALETDVLASTGGGVAASGQLALASVSESTWRAVRAFALRGGDVFGPDRPWAVDVTPVHLVVRSAHQDTDAGNPGAIRALLQAGYAERTPPDKPDEDRPVELCWADPGVGGGGESAFAAAVAAGTFWTAAMVQTWLHDELLPALERKATTNVGAPRPALDQRPWPWRWLRSGDRGDEPDAPATDASQRLTPRLAIESPAQGFPAPWDVVDTDAPALIRWLRNVQLMASMRTPPADAVLGAQNLLVYGLQAGWGSPEFRAWLLHEFHAPTVETVTAMVIEASAASTPLPRVFDTLEFMTRGDAVPRSLTAADAEQTARVAGALRAAYQWWWDERIVERIWWLSPRR